MKTTCILTVVYLIYIFLNQFLFKLSKIKGVMINKITKKLFGSEVDMQTGFVYSYDGDIDNNIFLNKFDPISRIQTILGYFNFEEGTNFFPDSRCYDSNSKKYYFLILEGNQVKLVTASVASQPFSYTVIPLQNSEYSGNIGLEFSNETNTIFTVYSVYNQDNNVNDEIMIGTLNPNTGELTTMMT